ncbi:MAG TPA: hypothetical protein DCY06_08760 [Bacteroidetes bacterium]|nr:hypothetical protein [Bacteroidota bacterium]HRJ98315.1 hypothetical protein [Ignavibacteria bacterium]
MFFLNCVNLFSQEKEEPILYPATSLSQLIKFSSAKVVNNLPYDGKAFGFKNDKGTFITDYEALDTFEIKILDYDSIQFYSEYIRDGIPKVLDGFFLKVDENKSFTYTPLPVQDLVGLDIVTENVKKYKGRKLYEITIEDDVNAGEIEVMPLPESVSFIDIQRIDTAKYTATNKAIFQIKLKDTKSFANEVSKSILDRILKGEEVIMPIGIKLFDKKIPSHTEEYKIFLKKKKKKKTK